MVALSISIERYIALDRSKVAPPHLLATVWRDLKQGELHAQKLAQLRTNSPLGAILVAGVANRGQGRDVMKEGISEAASHVVHDLEKYLNSLGKVAAIALAGGIAEALFTTACRAHCGYSCIGDASLLHRPH